MSDLWGLHIAGNPTYDDFMQSVDARSTGPQTLHRGVGLLKNHLDPGLHDRLHRAVTTGQPDPDLIHDVLHHVDREGQGMGEYWSALPEDATSYSLSAAEPGQDMTQPGYMIRKAPADYHVLISGDWDGQGGQIAHPDQDDNVYKLNPGSGLKVRSVKVRRGGRSGKEWGDWVDLGGDSTDGIRYAHRGLHIAADHGGWYHVTHQKLFPGDRITPGGGESRWTDDNAYADRGNHVWLSDDDDHVGYWLAQFQKGLGANGLPNLYEVHPDQPPTLYDDNDPLAGHVTSGATVVQQHDPHDFMPWLDGHHTASTDGIRYAHVVEADVAEDLHRLGMPVAPYSGPPVGPSWHKPKMERELAYNWQMPTYYNNHRHIQEGVDDVLANGYAGLNDRSWKQLRRQLDSVPDGHWDRSEIGVAGKRALRAQGRELASRVINSEPTADHLYRGVLMHPDDIAELVPGHEFHLPVSAFSPSRVKAHGFAGDLRHSPWTSYDKRHHPEGHQGVVFRLQPGAKAAPIPSGVGNASPEHVSFGRYRVIDVKPGRQLTDHPTGAALQGGWDKEEDKRIYIPVTDSWFEPHQVTIEHTSLHSPRTAHRTAMPDQDSVTLYHHTWPESAQKILDHGFKQRRDHVFLSTKPYDPELIGRGEIGDTVLRVQVPRRALSRDSIQPKDRSVRWFTVPVDVINQLPVRLHTAHRTAMPAPMPEGITFHHHPTNDTIPTQPWPADPSHLVPRFTAPAVEARHNGETVGYLEWDPPLHATVVNGIQYGDHPPEVSMIKVHKDYRRHGIGTALFDFARQHQGDLEHSDSRTELGNKWVDYEQSRSRALARLAAAVGEDLLGRLHDEFHDWLGDGDGGKIDGEDSGDDDFITRQIQKMIDAGADIKMPSAPKGVTRHGENPLGNWPTIEQFMKDKYPAAHRPGFYMGMEQAQPLMDGRGMFGDPVPDEDPYETGPEAVAKHGYDPKEIAAGMLLLHNRAHGHRSDLEDADLDRLTDITRIRSQQQRAYEHHQRQPVTARTAAPNDLVTIYHGTTEDRAQAILDGQRFHSHAGAWFTTDPERAKAYGSAVIATEVPARRIPSWTSPRGNPEFYVPRSTRLLTRGPFRRHPG